MKPHAFAMLFGIVVLPVHWHTVAIRSHCLRRCYWRSGHRKRGQGQREQKYRKENVAEHGL
jgi:hypothetical protein